MAAFNVAVPIDAAALLLTPNLNTGKSIQSTFRVFSLEFFCMFGQ